MHKIIAYDQLHTLARPLLVDLRSSREYRHAHIPDAVSFPLFSDEEYAAIGKEYTHGSKETAVLLGIELASKRLPSIAGSVHRWNAANHTVVLYCYRGGYRSSVPFSILQSLGIPAYKLMGGYKSHRKYVNSHWEEALQGKRIIGLYGNTGCGKTKILHALRQRGASVLDLEALANHRGSLLGGVGLGPQPSQKMFESLLQKTLFSQPHGFLFVEGESRKIGDLFVPKPFFDAMQTAEKVRIDAPLSYRAALLEETYATNSLPELAKALTRLQAFIGQNRVEDLLDRLRRGEILSVTEELLSTYYDPRYRMDGRSFAFTLEHADPDIAADALLNRYPNLL